MKTAKEAPEPELEPEPEPEPESFSQFVFQIEASPYHVGLVTSLGTFKITIMQIIFGGFGIHSEVL